MIREPEALEFIPSLYSASINICSPFRKGKATKAQGRGAYCPAALWLNATNSSSVGSVATILLAGVGVEDAITRIRVLSGWKVGRTQARQGREGELVNTMCESGVECCARPGFVETA